MSKDNDGTLGTIGILDEVGGMIWSWAHFGCLYRTGLLGRSDWEEPLLKRTAGLDVRVMSWAIRSLLGRVLDACC